MKVNRSDHRTDNNLKELVATISDVAFEYATDTEEAYEIACLVLVRILKDTSLEREIGYRRASTKYSH
jgi:hypothetical protein